MPTSFVSVLQETIRHNLMVIYEFMTSNHTLHYSHVAAKLLYNFHLNIFVI